MLKTIVFLLFFTLLSTLQGQSKVDSLTQLGVSAHDQQNYEQALKYYQQALTLNPGSVLIQYETALTYMALKNYEECIKYCDKVIDKKDKYLAQAYGIKGSALDNMGKTKASIKTLKKGIRKGGEHYSLLFNLGITYVRAEEWEKGEKAIVEAIKLNPTHSSSHYVLSIIKQAQSQKIPSMLARYFFLLIEPQGKRAEETFVKLQEQINGNVSRDKEKPSQINITLASANSDSEFGFANTMLSLMVATNPIKKEEGKSDAEILADNSSSLFNILATHNGKKSKNLSWEFYIPFFQKLAQTEQMLVFANHISQSSSSAARNWLSQHQEKKNILENWVAGNIAETR